MNGYLELLRQVKLDTRGYRTMARMSWILLAAGLFLLIVSGFMVGNPIFAQGLGVASFWGIAHVWCGAVLKSVVLQNRPEFAVLAPQLRARAIRLIVVLYAAVTILAGIFGGLVFGHAGYALLLGAAMSVYVLFVQRYSMLALLPAAVILACSQMGDWGSLERLLQQTGEFTITLVGMALLLPLGAWGVHQTLPRGGDAHWRWFKHYQERQWTLRGQPSPQSDRLAGARWSAFLRFGYAAALARDSRRGAAPGRMMMYVLGPKSSPVGYTSYALLAAVIVLASAWYYGAHGIPPMFHLMVQLMMMMGCQMYVQSAIDGVLRHRAEQAIFGLTAGAPAKAQINRLLMCGLLRGFVGVWLVSALCTMVVDAVVIGRLEVRGLTSMIMVTSAALGLLLLRDYATMDLRAKERQATIAMLAVIVAYALISAFTVAWQAVPWHGISAALAVVIVAIAVQRWRKLVAMPPVLPAGRLVL